MRVIRRDSSAEVWVIVSKKTLWIAVAGGAALAGGAAMRAGLNQAWKLAKDEDPPLDPSSWEVEWKDAILWTIATGVAMGLAGLFARRGAAAGWHRLMGERPPY